MKLLALPAILVAFLAYSPLARANPIVIGGVYEETGSALCQSASICVIAFSKAPAGKILMVDRVSCMALKSLGNYIFKLEVGQFAGWLHPVTRPQFFAPVKVSQSTALELFQANDDVELAILNNYPAVSLSTFGVPLKISLQCTIIGKLQ